MRRQVLKVLPTLLPNLLLFSALQYVLAEAALAQTQEQSQACMGSLVSGASYTFNAQTSPGRALTGTPINAPCATPTRLRRPDSLLAAAPAAMPDAVPERVPVGTPPTTTFTLSASDKTDAAVASLRGHDVCLLVDNSQVMNDTDYLDGGQISKFDWCCKNTVALARSAVAAESDMTLIFYGDKYVVYEHVKPDQVPQVFECNRPHGRRFLAAPLSACLGHYFKARAADQTTKPLYVAVALGGHPTDVENVEALIKNSDRQISSPREVVISFLSLSCFWCDPSYDFLNGDIARLPTRNNIVCSAYTCDVRERGLAGALAWSLTPQCTADNDRHRIPPRAPVSYPYPRSAWYLALRYLPPDR
jgi:hypothetical protein